MQFSGNSVQKRVNSVQRKKQIRHSNWSIIKETHKQPIKYEPSMLQQNWRELPRKSKITNRPSVTLCSSDPTPKLKTNMVKPRKRRFEHRLNNYLNFLAGLLTVLRLKDVKISLHIIGLIVRGCFDRTHGLNKSFLHLIRALCLCLIMISCLVIFHVYY